jgi:hypothetical protein
MVAYGMDQPCCEFQDMFPISSPINVASLKVTAHSISSPYLTSDVLPIAWTGEAPQDWGGEVALNWSKRSNMESWGVFLYLYVIR